jgi:hypothetical protein
MLGLEEDDVALGPTREGRKEEKKKTKKRRTLSRSVHVHVRVPAWRAHLSGFAGAPLSFFFLLLFFSVSFSNIDLELI